MNTKSRRQAETGARRGYLLLAASILVAAGLLLVLLWQVPRFLPPLAGPQATAIPAATWTSVAPPSPTPAISRPAITDLGAEVDDRAATITFHLAAEVPPGRRVAEVLLWYDTETGHRLQRTGGALAERTAITYRLGARQEGLTRTMTTSQELDYWWLVRDTAGETIRAGGTVRLGPALQALVAAPPPQTPPLDFTWAVSASKHFEFYYMPGTAAERDLARLGSMAEAALARTSAVLEMEFDGQMDIYFVPRIFWQGGAAYGNKVQLISYLDRNYTGIETWSYFTHEGTHALAQDLLQPKEEGGGPDGVLVEGLAVWASGGHYRIEPIDAWAAVIVQAGEYIPLAELRAGPFYDFQHETSYLEAASFVKFLIDTQSLGTFKELYGQASGNISHDETLVSFLYHQSYAGLEAGWLTWLSGQQPTASQAETWRLKVRSFDLMRRYETELDPDARILPGQAPPEWTSDTLKIFMGRVNTPLNIALETALIAAQERLYGDDLAGAAALLDDVEAALDAGARPGRIGRLAPSLQARVEILDLLATQDRAILRADADAYRQILTPAYAQALDARLEEILSPPYTTYWQELVQLDLADDGLSAEGVVLLHTTAADGPLDGDGRLRAIRLQRADEGWLLAGGEPFERVWAPLPPLGD